MSDSPNEILRNLLRATAQGESAAFRTLYDETSARLFAVALAMLQDSALAEDVLQDAFVQIWHRAGDYHADRGNVLTWLTTIVRYRAIDLLRKRRRGGPADEPRSFDVDPADIDYLLVQDDDTANSGDGTSPLACAISSEENSQLRDCVERLSNSQQKSVALAFFRGFTHKELADCLAEPLGTIKSRLRRSLARLRECLESLEDSIEVRRRTS